MMKTLTNILDTQIYLMVLCVNNYTSDELSLEVYNHLLSSDYTQIKSMGALQQRVGKRCIS
jgi:hypothetical protein